MVNLLTADVINASFEFIGGLFVLNNCRMLYKDKMVKGISKLSVVYFSGWGLANVTLIYNSAGLWLSYYAGLLIFFANIIWISQMVYYSKFYKKELF